MKRNLPPGKRVVSSMAAKMGFSAHTVHEGVKKDEVDSGERAELPSDVAEKMKALGRENRELRQGLRS